MQPTTGSILRRITETELSVSAHKLATVILDAIAWKDGYNGLSRGTAAFTLSALAERMAITRQHLTHLLAELAASGLRLLRWKPHGKYAPWFFRFGFADEGTQDVASTGDDTSLYRESSNKTIFSGRIEIGQNNSVYRTRWAELIKTAKTALPCWNVDTQAIWERFLAFNRSRGNTCVPAGFLLGFMRRWQVSAKQGAPTPPERQAGAVSPDPQSQELMHLTQVAPVQNRHFHARDLQRKIGGDVYEARVVAMQLRYSCGRYSAMLAVHGQAVQSGEVER